MPEAKGKVRGPFTPNSWPRKPDGGCLPLTPPNGHQTPNGIMWAHELDEFVNIERRPSQAREVLWTRSMVKEVGENYDKNTKVQRKDYRRNRTLVYSDFNKIQL